MAGDRTGAAALPTRSEKIAEAARALSSAKLLGSLKGLSKDFDQLLNFHGSESIARALSRYLLDVLEGDQSLWSRLEQMIGAIEAEDKAEDVHWRPLAEFVAELSNNHPDVRDELAHGGWTSIHKGLADQYREGGITGISAKIHNDQLFKEFGDVEAAIFSCLKSKLTTSRDEAPGNPELATELHRQPCSLPPPALYIQDGLSLNLLDWNDMQQQLKGLVLESLDGGWSKGLRRSILWLLQNGEAEQFLGFLHARAKDVDDELRGTFIAILSADTDAKLPPIWKTAAYRALRRS